MKSILDVNQLRKVYQTARPFTAVDEISFAVQPGEILGFLGPNGSGKTTTIQMLLGILIPTSGSIAYFGKELTKYRSEILQNVSFASTYTSLPSALTIEENLKWFGRMYGYSGKQAMQKASPLLERFGILDKKKCRVGSLSAGQITRLVLVKAFFTEPKIALLDEPTASLDPDISQEVCEFLLEERNRSGLSILFTSHKMSEVVQLCDRAIFLKAGKIMANDLPKNLAKSASPTKLCLTIDDGLMRAQALAKEGELPYTLEHRLLHIEIDEKKIPPFLNALMQQGVSYTSIRIEEPTLENYFLSLAGRSKK